MYLELSVPEGLKVLSINKQHQDLLDSHQKSKKHLGRGETTISDHTSRLRAMGSRKEEEGNQGRIQTAPSSLTWLWLARETCRSDWQEETRNNRGVHR